MANQINPHEPLEELVSSVEEVLEEADLSEKRWRDFEREHRLVTIQLSGERYEALEQMARQQNRPIGELAADVLGAALSHPLSSPGVGGDVQR